MFIVRAELGSRRYEEFWPITDYSGKWIADSIEDMQRDGWTFTYFGVAL